MRVLGAATRRYAPLVLLLHLAPYLAAQCASDATHTGPLSAQLPKCGTSSMRLLQNGSAKVYGPKTESNSVLHCSAKKAAQYLDMTLSTSVLGVVLLHTELRNALEHRKQNPLTPYKVDAWTHELRNLGEGSSTQLRVQLI
jgi:hypothetical protein